MTASTDSQPRGEPVRCLIVDDSAIVRLSMKRLLEAHGEFVVDLAGDPLEAREQMRRRAPDVLLLDVEMPRQDGLSFLEELRRESELPVVMFSNVTARGSRNAVRALALGATEVLSKPTRGLRSFVAESGERLSTLLYSLGISYRLAPRRHARSSPSPPSPPSPLSNTRPVIGTDAPRADPAPASPLIGRLRLRQDRTGRMPVLLLGASTGGLPALETLLGQLPGDCAPVLIAQHMPAEFMDSLRDRIDRMVTPSVKLAGDRESLAYGHVYIAPGDHHLGVEETDAGLIARTSQAPRVNRHRPSVDYLFDTAARLQRTPVVAAILTGMGEDGARGLLHLKQAGALTFAQTPASCVVAGMPGSAIELGATSDVASLATIGATMAEMSRSRLARTRERGALQSGSAFGQ